MISFRSKITRKILDYFFLNPSAREYGSALARSFMEDPKNIYRKLLELEKEGIMKSEYSGRQRYFFLSRTYPLMADLKRVYLASAGFEHALGLALRAVPGLTEAYIFGSYAKGTMDTSSDIDILAIGSHTERVLQKAINPLQRSVARDINVTSMTHKELDRRKAAKDPFLRSLFRAQTKRIV